MMRRVGVVVNPIAGMGGRVGLKGTDNKVEEARRRGAEPRATDRATEALEHLRRQAADVELVVWGGRMGEAPALAAGFEEAALAVLGGPADPDETSAADTRAATRAFVEWSGPDGDGLDLILFVGGDGTAVDVAETLDELDAEIPMLGVPAGVKVYSSVFAVTPRAAGRLAATFDRVETREVNDIDEDAYRGGDVRTDLKALARVPVGEEVQSSKQIGGGSVEALAQAVAAEIRDDEGTTYVLGPGSTVDAVKTELGFDGSPLGVDVWRDGEVLARDAGESDILANLDERNVVVVSPIGGQGFVFGRGNPQISPAVIRQCDVQVVASSRKLEETGVLRVDTGDTGLDDELRGWQRVRVGKFERRLMEVV
jgi:predicted polyphosphate/ATP-dependent NAD kinase